MLADLITRASLQDLAGDSAFQRGEAYLRSGVVGRIRTVADKISAKVEGTETYQVELRDDDGELVLDCTCPRAGDGYFCKHGVALGLAWLSDKPSVAKPGVASVKRKRRDPWREIKDFLSLQPADVTVGLLLDVAERDDRLYQSLLLKAERSRGGTDVAKAFRRAIDEATQIRGFVDWRDVGSLAGDIGQVVDGLAELLKPDTAPALVDLTEYAIERIEKSLEHIDDSNGEIGDIVCRLGELHVKACRMARPEPAELAERLFRLETTLSFGLCSFDVITYRVALGKEGLRRYRELADNQWRKLKPRGSNDSYDAGRASITRIMEQLAEVSGNIEELVAIKARDLTSSYRYLDIAEVWTKAGQPDKALQWAERGLKESRGRPDNRLRDFLVAIYLKRRRHDEALRLTWIQFEEQACLEHYKKLHDVARKLNAWPEQRMRALAKLDAVVATETDASLRSKRKPSAPNLSLRVQIALWEEDLDAAWLAAHQGHCDQNLLISLAGKLAASRPADAISLYRRVVPSIVDRTNNTAYDDAAKLIRKVGGLMKAQNQSRQFGDYLAELGFQFKLKRNFIKLLDAVARSAAK